MGFNNSLTRTAAGTINPFTFIQSGAMATNPPNAEAGELLALQCTGAAGAEIIGIGAEWTNAMMGTAVQTGLVPQGFPAATAGQSIRVYEDGENAIIMVGSGVNVVADQLLTSDASGNAIPSTNTASSHTQWIGARAIESGTAGQVIRVQVYTR